MKCVACIAENERSKVFMSRVVLSPVPVLTFWDEDGVLHTHDPNRVVSNYHCSRGHSWEEVYEQACHECKKGEVRP